MKIIHKAGKHAANLLLTMDHTFRPLIKTLSCANLHQDAHQASWHACLVFVFMACVLYPGISGSSDARERLRVHLVSFQQTTLSAEISAKLLNLPLREGDSFQSDQILANFDCSLFEAQLEKAKAGAEVARQTHKVNMRLNELGSISSLECDQSAAKVKETEAELSAITTVVSKCVLTAPFTGRIAKLYAENYQYMTPGKPIMDILDTVQLEIRLIVPSRWLTWLKTGSTFTVNIDETGRSYPARVSNINPRVDPISQTISLTAKIEGKHAELLPGMSGWANFSR